MDDTGCCSPSCRGDDDVLYEDSRGDWYCGFCLLAEHEMTLPEKLSQAGSLVDDLVRQTLNLTDEEKKIMLEILGPTS